MPYTLDYLEDEAIVIVTLVTPLDVQTAPKEIVAKIAAIQREYTEDLYVILDATELEIKFTEIVFALANTFVGRMPEGLNRDKLHRTLVSTHRFARMWVDAIQQSQYGGYQYHIVTTRDEALKRVRAIISDTMGTAS